MNKLNPRLLVHGVSCELSADDIESEIVALNLKDIAKSEVKVIYIFPPRNNRRITNCIIEISPNVRSRLLNEKHIFINYSAAFPIMLECFNVSNVWLLAILSRTCTKKTEDAVCGNCKRWPSNEGASHSAMDGNRYPILRCKLMDTIKQINYG